MITSIGLINFKCFKRLKLDLQSLNVFAGMNGAGKSTVIHGLLALRQSWEAGRLFQGHVQLNGRLVELGTSGEVYCKEPESDQIEILLESSEADSLLDIRSRQSELRANSYSLAFEGNVPSTKVHPLFHEPFNYLHAERVGPRKSYQIPPDEGHPLSVGRYGENASFIVASDCRETTVGNEALHLESAGGRILHTIQYQWPLWMGRLFPGFDGDSEIYQAADQVRLALALGRKQTGQSLFVRPTNTGFGISFVMGVIVAGLVASRDTVLIVENPEAHLHPRAQSLIGDFLARVAAGGAQVFVETHSEHVLNGMRKVVKQGHLSSESMCVHFFAPAAGSLEPVVTRIPVSAAGDISKWPEGFFDQLDHDLSIILG